MRGSRRQLVVVLVLGWSLLSLTGCQPATVQRSSKESDRELTSASRSREQSEPQPEQEPALSAEPRQQQLAIQPLAALPEAAESSTEEPSAASSAVPPAVPPAASSAEFSAVPSANPSAAQRIVKVFYGTDRLALRSQHGLWRFPTWWLVTGFVVTVTAIFAAALLPNARGTALAAAGASLLVTIVLATLQARQAGDGNFHLRPGSVEYGNERGELRFGECEVSIPANHESGEVERPSIWRLELSEREDRHVVLQRVTARDSQAFFRSLREQVSESPRRDLFVFIHGYNVSFSMAARRTAQMKLDLGFEGAAVFYSWPSQGGLLRYTVDENNVAWTTPHLKQFLRDVAQRSEAQSIYLIAHSMGNRALGSAMCDLADDAQRRSDARAATLFTEVVLAAPDIDADVFERDVAPAILKTAQHATLYASARDQALRASKVVHGYPRAGDAGEELVIVPGIVTIDVSAADLSLLGHSYYAECGPIESDLEMLLSGQRSTNQRGWLEPSELRGKRFWTLRDRHLSLSDSRWRGSSRAAATRATDEATKR
ncbi:MAG: alpha/beta hydrolase [Planctomycetota bacterium]